MRSDGGKYFMQTSRMTLDDEIGRVVISAPSDLTAEELQDVREFLAIMDRQWQRRIEKWAAQRAEAGK